MAGRGSRRGRTYAHGPTRDAGRMILTDADAHPRRDRGGVRNNERNEAKAAGVLEPGLRRPRRGHRAGAWRRGPVRTTMPSGATRAGWGRAGDARRRRRRPIPAPFDLGGFTKKRKKRKN